MNRLSRVVAGVAVAAAVLLAGCSATPAAAPQTVTASVTTAVPTTVFKTAVSTVKTTVVKTTKVEVTVSPPPSFGASDETEAACELHNAALKDSGLGPLMGDALENKTITFLRFKGTLDNYVAPDLEGTSAPVKALEAVQDVYENSSNISLGDMTDDVFSKVSDAWGIALGVCTGGYN